MTRTNLKRQQLSLDFSSPGDHAELIHSGDRHGTVLFWERLADDGKRWIKCRPTENLPAIAEQLRSRADAYFTVNQFARAGVKFGCLRAFARSMLTSTASKTSISFSRRCFQHRCQRRAWRFFLVAACTFTGCCVPRLAKRCRSGSASRMQFSRL